MFSYPKFNKNGVKVLSRINGVNKDMLMDISVIRISAGDRMELGYTDMESAILLINGKITFYYDDKAEICERADTFKDSAICLHIPKGVEVIITAEKDSEIILQCAENDKTFETKLYREKDIRFSTSCKGKWENTAVRDVVTIIDYENAPYSNLVIGEILVPQGRWFGYIPHSHPQPEVYYYKMARPEGFGACFIGDKAYTIKDGSCGAFPGGLNHPNVTAPGYPMYAVWMIRHLPNNPWTDRINDPRFTWLLE
jgi:5-deoxy-glucuronate isomerase